VGRAPERQLSSGDPPMSTGSGDIGKRIREGWLALKVKERLIVVGDGP
jgi:hypothetical protein